MINKKEYFRVFADENLAYVEGEDASEIKYNKAFHLLPDENGDIPEKGPYAAFEEIQYDKSKFPLIDGPKTTPESEWTCGRKDLTYRSVAEINELASMFESPEAAKKTLGVYRPGRLALHETIVAVSTMVRCVDDQDMRRKVKMIYPAVLNNVRKIEPMLEAKRQDFDTKISVMVGKLAKHEKIGTLPLANFVKDKYNFVMNAPKEPNMGALKAVIALAWGEAYTKYASDIISQMARTEVFKAIKAGKLEVLPVPNPSDRVGFMMFGGPGSGKSTSKAAFDDMFKEKGLTTADAVVINTDAYRYLLTSRDVGDMDFSTITYLESSTIRNKVLDRLWELNREGKCPHCLFDQIYPSEKIIKFSTYKGGNARMEGVARYVVTALWAAKNRGDASKRYVDTVNLFELHQDACKKLPKTLAQSKGKNLFVRIRDNNKLASDGKKAPEAIFEANMLDGVVNILNVEKFYNYILNITINTQAKDKSEVYDLSKVQSIDKYLEPLKEVGIKINYPQDHLEQKGVKINKSPAKPYTLEEKGARFKRHIEASRTISPETTKKMYEDLFKYGGPTPADNPYAGSYTGFSSGSSMGDSIGRLDLSEEEVIKAKIYERKSAKTRDSI